MRKIRRLGLSLVLAVLMLVGLTVPAAANEVVTIYVSAQFVAITNSEAVWNITVVGLGGTAYFSATNAEDDTYSQILNTGNVACNVSLHGTDFVATNTSYNWDLDTAAGNQTYSLYTNSGGVPTVYDVEVREEAVFANLCTSLAPAGTYDWSMLFTAPDEFHATDDGGYKTASVTLVAIKA